MKTDGHIGERIVAARKRAGLTQAQLAREVGCSQQTLCDIESEAVSRSAYLTAVIDAVGETAGWILRGEGMPAGACDADGCLPLYDITDLRGRVLSPADADVAVDFMFRSPVSVSQGAYTVLVDAHHDWLMSGTLAFGEILVVDPAVEASPGRLVVALMEDWNSAAVLRLDADDAGALLRAEAGDPNRWHCRPVTTLTELKTPAAPMLRPPALILGVVVAVFSLV